MRSVAPDSAGAAASQNSWLVEYLNPSEGRLTATTLHTCQIANARNSAGTEIQRLILAIASPCCVQNALSSGVHTVRTRPLRRLGAPIAVVLTIVVSFETRDSAVGVAMRKPGLGTHDLLPAHFGEIHPDQRNPDDAVHQHERARPDARDVEQH